MHHHLHLVPLFFHVQHVQFHVRHEVLPHHHHIISLVVVLRYVYFTVSFTQQIVMQDVIENFKFFYRNVNIYENQNFVVFVFLSFYIIDENLLDSFIINIVFCFYIYNLIVVHCKDHKFNVDEFLIYMN